MLNSNAFSRKATHIQHPISLCTQYKTRVCDLNDGVRLLRHLEVAQVGVDEIIGHKSFLAKEFNHCFHLHPVRIEFVGQKLLGEQL